MFAALGIDLDPALQALRQELPIGPLPDSLIGPDGHAHDSGGPLARHGLAETRQDDPPAAVPQRRTLTLMVKIRDKIDGSIGPRWIDKTLQAADRKKLKDGQTWRAAA